MPMKLEKKSVTYDHEMDGRDKSKMTIPREVSVTPNSSLTEAVNAVGNPGRLECQYNVGKKPETKRIQGLK